MIDGMYSVRYELLLIRTCDFLYRSNAFILLYREMKKWTARWP